MLFYLKRVTVRVSELLGDLFPKPSSPRPSTTTILVDRNLSTNSVTLVYKFISCNPILSSLHRLRFMQDVNGVRGRGGTVVTTYHF